MELDEFVQKSIEQVISGVKNACEHARNSDATIQSSRLQPIDFDVAVTTSEGKETKKGGGITVWGAGINGQGTSESTSSTVSRIKFTVMVGLPDSHKRGPSYAVG